MSTKKVIKSDADKKLLPDSYIGKVNLTALAVEIKSAANLGNTSLAKLNEATSGGWISQTWNATDINRCVHDSLVAISTLSKAQIALQDIAIEINKKTLHEQNIIAQQQQQLASQQHELAAHDRKIEELILLMDHSSFYEELLDTTEKMKIALANANIQNEKHRDKIAQLKTFMVTLSLTQVCVVALILFLVMR